MAIRCFDEVKWLPHRAASSRECFTWRYRPPCSVRERKRERIRGREGEIERERERAYVCV